ncbi:LytR/AlgR family response regulator transcription factor [Flavobacterium sp. RHBU_24]|uniref:LytR/AlgR family response regulator transcription factor n=1 Tax=Flavobacterium sp. RHBU_24 TaxID=3391185 RepID=UPI00398529F5
MSNINVLIIEDTPAESDLLKKVLLDNNYTIAGVARTYSEALNLFYSCGADIVIIDIFLDGNPEGITFAETLNAVPDAARPFVFLTNSKDRQVFERAKLTKPFSFLMKPFNELEVLYAIEMAVEKFYGQNHVFLDDAQNTVISKDYLFIKKNNALRKVVIEHILYIEVEERYCTIITHSEKFLVMLSLKKITDVLSKDIFIRTHRNYLVNLDKIEEIILNDNLIIVTGNHKVALSDSYKDFVKQLKIFK